MSSQQFSHIYLIGKPNTEEMEHGHTSEHVRVNDCHAPVWHTGLHNIHWKCPRLARPVISNDDDNYEMYSPCECCDARCAEKCENPPRPSYCSS